jgi:rhodanese-related sulfurtransferase
MKALLVLLVVFLIGWDILWWGMGVEPVFPWQLKKALEERPDAFRLIDPRTAWEYEWFHIQGAESYPTLLMHPEILKSQDPEKPIVVICMSGHRSPIVAHRLKKRGFAKVYNLTWGMVGWLLSDGPIVRGKAQDGDIRKALARNL